MAGEVALASVAREGFLEEVTFGKTQEQQGALGEEHSRYEKQQVGHFWKRKLRLRQGECLAHGHRRYWSSRDAVRNLPRPPGVSSGQCACFPPVAGAAETAYICSLCQREVALGRWEFPCHGSEPTHKPVADWGSQSPAPAARWTGPVMWLVVLWNQVEARNVPEISVASGFLPLLLAHENISINPLPPISDLLGLRTWSS